MYNVLLRRGRKYEEKSLHKSPSLIIVLQFLEGGSRKSSGIRHPMRDQGLLQVLLQISTRDL